MRHRTGGTRRVRGGVLGSAIAVAALVGCADNHVIVDVDVASFLDASERGGHYNAPADSPAVDHDLAPLDLRIEGYDQLGAATEVTLDMEVQFVNVTGRGQGRFIVLLADSTQGLYETPPVATIAVPIAPATTSTGSVTVAGDARVLDLFRRQQMWVGIRLHWEPEDAAALDGDYTITRLHARVLTSLDLL